MEIILKDQLKTDTDLQFLLVCKFPFMCFKLNCSDCPCGTGEDNFCYSVSKE